MEVKMDNTFGDNKSFVLFNSLFIFPYYSLLNTKSSRTFKTLKPFQL